MVSSQWLRLRQVSPVLGLVRSRTVPRFEHFGEQAEHPS